MSSPGVDTQSRSQPHGEDYWCRLDQLDALLRKADFSTSPDRWQNAHDLLLKLLEAGRLPEDPSQLRPLLAPLFCRSAREQEQFSKLFEQWLRLILPQAEQGQLDEPAQSQKQQIAAPPTKNSLLPILSGLFLALILSLLGGYYMAWDPELDKPIQTSIPTIPTSTTGGGEQVPPPAIEELKLQPIPPRLPQELPSLDANHHAYVGASHWLFRLLPGLFGIAWLVLIWRGWQTVLERRRSARQQADPLHAITLTAEVDELLDSSPLRGALRRLHTPVAYPTRRLHLDATVQATARNAGLLHPVFADRMAVPECLVLVDYRHDADQMAALAQLASRRLEAAGLTIHRYHYQQDPRRVYEVASSGPGRWLSLTELAGRYPDARLLLIGEPAALIDPWSLALRPWAEVLAWWPQRGLLATRLPPPSWLRTFQAEGLVVADLSSAGLASMAEHLAGLPPQDQPTATRVLLPRELRNNEAWLTPLAPPETEQQALLQQLQRFLNDDGLLLFSAMAAYPELHWGLTRALDLNLTPDSDPETRELRLLRIARLPWCREGWLPDWLREAMLEQCGKTQRKTIANLYQQLMGLADIDGQGEISLPFDLSEPDEARGLRSWLKRLTQVAPDESNLSDRIFANALLGNRLRSIDFLLPRNLASHLPAGGMRLLLPRLLLVLLLSGLAGWGLDWSWERWLRNPAIELAQAAQLADHGDYGVKILHTGVTLQLAQALNDTLSRFGFQIDEMRELATDELSSAERPGGQVNTVQLGAAQDAQTAGFVARRLAYLTWGLEPVVANQLSEQLTTDETLQQPPNPGELRIWLLTPGRTGSPFSDPLSKPLTDAQLERWNTPPKPPKPEVPSRQPEQEPVSESSITPAPQTSEQQTSQAAPAPPLKIASEPRSSKRQQGLPKAQLLNVQKLLNELGYSPGPLDGILGSQTRNAIRQFQQNQDLPADGQPDAELLQQLREAVRLQQANQEQAAQDSKSKAPESRQQESKLEPVPTTQPQPPQLLQDKLSDGTLGPEMLVLPADSFLMGSPEVEPLRSSDEGPQRQVRIAAFAIGRTEVTFDQYDRFAKATGRELPADSGWGRGRRPVINVSWKDASAYAAWLSEQTGKQYRLPSEAEWEYAARAGTHTPFSTGDCIHTDQANYDGNYDYADCGAKTGLFRQKTVPAGSLPANPWGLHEVHGNVWEWVQDCWRKSYDGAPNDGSAWEAGDCSLRVVRGGGWGNRPENLRSAIRYGDYTDGAFYYLGFRLARTL